MAALGTGEGMSGQTGDPIRMLKIGIVDLDTSHPGRWVPILQEWDDVAVVACWDGGSVRPPGYAQQFADEHNIPAAVPALADMIPLVDVVFVQSCNWDLHLERVEPFVEAGKGVYIDKPLAGNVADLLQLKDWVTQGADIIGGSSLRCCEEVKRIHAQTEGSDLYTIFASGPNDFFNYGIHVVEMVQGVSGLSGRSPAVAVTHLGSHHSERLLVDYQSGLQVLLELQAAAGFFLSVSAGNGHWSATIQSDFYRALLQDVVAHFRATRRLLPRTGRMGQFPADIDLLSEAVMILLAGQKSMRRGRLTPVFIDEIAVDAPGFDGDLFTAHYRASVG